MDNKQWTADNEQEKLMAKRLFVGYEETQKRNRFVAAILVAVMVLLGIVVVIRVVLW